MNSINTWIVVAVIGLSACAEKPADGAWKKASQANYDLCMYSRASTSIVEADVVGWGAEESIPMTGIGSFRAVPVNVNTIRSLKGTNAQKVYFGSETWQSNSSNVATASGMLFLNEVNGRAILIVNGFFRRSLADGLYRNTGMYKDGVKVEEIETAVEEFGARTDLCPVEVARRQAQSATTDGGLNIGPMPDGG